MLKSAQFGLSVVKLEDIRPEFPNPDAVQAYEALSFLYMHSPRHADWSVKALRMIVQLRSSARTRSATWTLSL